MAIHSLNSLKCLYWRAHSPASYPTSSVGNRPAENVLPNLSTTAVVPGSWAYEQRGQPNEEADCDSSCRCQEDVRRPVTIRKYVYIINGGYIMASVYSGIDFN